MNDVIAPQFDLTPPSKDELRGEPESHACWIFGIGKDPP